MRRGIRAAPTPALAELDAELCDRAEPSLHRIGDQFGDLPRVAQTAGRVDHCSRYRGEGYSVSDDGGR
jgi:hypothetical protein